jgi:hypothetical protein
LGGRVRSSPNQSSSLTIYPLFVTPRTWRVSPQDLEGATVLARLNSNLVRYPWAGRERIFAPICAGVHGNQLDLRLMRLKKDAIEEVDLANLTEETISPGVDQFFGDSALLVTDPTCGLAVGEYNPDAVKVLGEWPARLLNQALKASGLDNPIEFHPFPSPSFRDVVMGRVVKKYQVILGPASVPSLEALGFGGETIKRVVRNDEVTRVSVAINVKASEGTTEDRAGTIERLAEKLGLHHAQNFKLQLDDGEVFDMLRPNYVSFELDVKTRRDPTPEELRDAKFAALRELLTTHKKDLLGAVPPTRVRPLDDWPGENARH